MDFRFCVRYALAELPDLKGSLEETENEGESAAATPREPEAMPCSFTWPVAGVEDEGDRSGSGG